MVLPNPCEPGCLLGLHFFPSPPFNDDCIIPRTPLRVMEVLKRRFLYSNRVFCYKWVMKMMRLFILFFLCLFNYSEAAEDQLHLITLKGYLGKEELTAAQKTLDVATGTLLIELNS